MLLSNKMTVTIWLSLLPFYFIIWLSPSWILPSAAWQTFSLFALSELVCTKHVFYPILLFPLLSHPKLLPLWSIKDRQTEGRTTFFTPLYLTSFFFHWAPGALPAGATLLGWPNYGVDGRLNQDMRRGICRTYVRYGNKMYGIRNYYRPPQGGASKIIWKILLW